MVRMIEAARVKSVEVWTAPYVIGTAGVSFAASVTWQGTSSDLKHYDDTNVANTATYLKTKPPKNTNATFWTQEGTSEAETLFFLTVPVGGVIDLMVELTMGGLYAGVNPTIATANATTNKQFYYFPLDGQTGALKPTGSLVQIQ